MFKTAVLSSFLCLSGWSANAASAATCSTASNLVQNCGFETGDFLGWAVLGDTVHVGVDTFDAHSGSYGAYLGGFGSFASGDQNFTLLQQTLATQPGRSYALTYYSAHFTNADVTSDNVFGAEIDNSLIPSSVQLNVADLPYTESVPYTFVASSATTTLGFLAEDANFVFSLDDVSLVATPEPSSLFLVAAVLGIAIFKRPRSEHSQRYR